MSTGQPTATVSYFIESRPAGTGEQWEQTGLRYSWQDPSKSDEKLAWARKQHPEREHQLVTRTTVVTEHPTAAPAAPDGRDLRDRIAAALLARIKLATVSKAQPFDAVTSLLAPNEFDLADAVLAVLPAHIDPSDEAIDWKAKYEVEHARHIAVVSSLVANRAAVLREAAEIAEDQRQLSPAFGARKPAQISENVGILRVANEFRRLAAEAQQAGEGR